MDENTRKEVEDLRSWLADLAKRIEENGGRPEGNKAIEDEQRAILVKIEKLLGGSAPKEN